MNIELRETCASCPEQYDAFVDRPLGTKRLVGYLRLRHGRFTVRCPDVNGKEVYAKEFDDPFLGNFENDSQRIEQLVKARAAIEAWIDDQEDVSFG